MELLLLNIDSEVEQTITNLCRPRALVCHSVSDIDAALEKLRATELDVVLLPAAAAVAAPASACSALARACRAQDASLVLLLDDVARLGQLDDELRDALDDFVLPPHDAAHLDARLDLIARRWHADAQRRAIVRALPDAMFRVTRDGMRVDGPGSRPAPADPRLPGRVVDALPPEHAQRCKAAAAEVLETGAPGYLEYSVPRPDGERFYQARLVRSSAGEVLVLLRDVTEHRSAEERLRSAAVAKQAFAARVLSVQEAERQHLSRELHDSISQLLLVHRMDAEWLAGQADSDPVRDAAERLCTGLDETLHLVRTLAMDLRPPAIDDLGIDSALGTLCADISRHSGIRCQFEADARTRALPEEIGVILFRIAQEALTNAVRHAKCRNIRVELLQQARTIELRVDDDGIGIPADRLADTTSFGLVGMRERAELVGGHVSIRTGPRDGTSIHALIPYTPYRPGPVNTQAPSREGKP